MSTRKLVRPLLTGALGPALALALGGLTGCRAQSKPVPPPPGGITADRSLGDIMVRFRPPAVNDSVEAGKLLAEIQGRRASSSSARCPAASGWSPPSAITPTPRSTGARTPARCAARGSRRAGPPAQA